MSACARWSTEAPRRLMAAGASVVLAAGLSACAPPQPSEVPSASPATTADPTPVITGPADGVELTIPEDMELSDEELEAVEAAHASYVAYLNFDAAVFAGDWELADRADEFATGSFLEGFEELSARYEQEGLVRVGAPAVEWSKVVRVADLGDMDKQVVELAHCMDISEVEILDEEGALAGSSGDASEFYRAAQFERSEGHWLPATATGNDDVCP